MFNPLPTQSRPLTILRKKPFENIVGKGEPAFFFLFPTLFSTLPNMNSNFSVALISLSLTAFNSIPHNPERPCERILLKTFRKKEKMLVTSIFSFFHNVFYPIKERNQHFSYIEFVACSCFQLRVRASSLIVCQRELFTTQSRLLKKPFRIIDRRENDGNQHFLLFPQQISIFQSHLFLSSANAFSLTSLKNCCLVES